MEPIAKYLLENVSNARVRRSANRAFNALFEGLTPQQKTRRAIRGMLPEPPGGWDAPAMDADGNQRFTAENGRPMTYAEALEYHIRNSFFHDNGRSNPKFEPGVARIAYKELGLWPEGLSDWTAGQRPATQANGELSKFSRVLREISASHSDDYDSDLNGMSWNEIKAQFAHGSTGEKYVNEEADGTGCKYRVVPIRNFNEAKTFGKYTENTQQWCLTEYRRYWNQYTKGNTVKMYFLVSPDIDEVEPEPGPNAPLDEYGLSLIGVGIAPDGTLDNCCTRWNHMHGGSDMALTEEQLCKLLNVRELSDVCPPFTENDRQAGQIKFQELVELVKRDIAENGTRSEQIEGFGQVKVYKITVDNGAIYNVVLNAEYEPIFNYPIWDCEVFGGFCMVATYDPFFGETDTEQDDDYDGDSTPHVIIRHDGKVHTNPEDNDEITYSDVLEGNNIPRGMKGINYGRGLLITAPFEDTYLFDVGRMAMWDTDVDIDKLAGNMFSDRHDLYVATPEGLKFLTEGVYEYNSNCIYSDTCVGIPLESDDGSDDLRFEIYNFITGECLLWRNEVADYNQMVANTAVQLIYQGDDEIGATYEIIDADGNVLVKRIPMPEHTKHLNLLCRDNYVGMVHRQGCLLVDSKHILRGDYIRASNGGISLKNPRIVELPEYASDILEVKMPFAIETDAGMTFIANNKEDSEDSNSRYFLVAPDGTRHGPYSHWSTTPDAFTVNLYRQSGNSQRLVNFVDMKTGKPYLDEKMENTLYERLHWAVGLVQSNTVLLEFFPNPGEQPRAFSLSMPGGFKEIDPGDVRRAIDENNGANVWLGVKD